MKLNENLKLFRKKRGLTQKELAEKIGVTSTTITRYEKNVRTPDINTLQRIANVLEIPLNKLLSTTIDQQSEIIEDILKYISDLDTDSSYDPYLPSHQFSLKECFNIYFGFELPPNNEINEDNLTFMLFTIINNDLNKFIQLFSLYHELILSFNKQNIKVIDDTLKEFNLSIEKLNLDLETTDKANYPNIFKNSIGSKYIDYSSNEIKDITKGEAWICLFNLIDYVRKTSSNKDLIYVGKDIDELEPLFNKIYELIDLELLKILYNRGQLINPKNLKGDDNNGNQEK